MAKPSSTGQDIKSCKMQQQDIIIQGVGEYNIKWTAPGSTINAVLALHPAQKSMGIK